MTLIDTSAWVEFLRRSGSPAVKQRVATLVELDQAAFSGPIEFELLSGARGREVDTLESLFAYAHRLDFDGACWRKAAELESSLRRKGVTVPRDDVFVAAAALIHDAPLLAVDAHFVQMVDRGRIPLHLLDLSSACDL